MKRNIKLGVTLLIITAIAGLLLGTAYSITKEPIAQAAIKTKEAAMKEILADGEEFKTMSVDLSDNPEIFEVNAAYKNNEIIGYAIKVAPSGYSGPVELMVGISNEGQIGGIKVLFHSETPGLGANSTKPEFYGQYAGKPIDKSLAVVKGVQSNDNEIEAITGATITSAAVTEGVNEAINFYKDKLKNNTKGE